MKRNAYYLVCGFIAVILVGLFGVSVLLEQPLVISVAVILSAVLYFVLRKSVIDVILDERQMLINMKTSSLTMKIAAVLFLALNLPIAVYAFGPGFGLPPIPHGMGGPFMPTDVLGPMPATRLGTFAVMEIILMIAVLFIYAGIRMYYSKKFGGEDGE